MERCRVTLTSFKEYTRGVAYSTVGHALAIVWSLYPSVKLDMIDGHYAQGVSDDQIAVLEVELEESAIKLADDLDLFSEQENRQQ